MTDATPQVDVPVHHRSAVGDSLRDHEGAKGNEASVTGMLLLKGIVGSTAYGLARKGSDVDRLGVFAAPSESFFGLHPPVGKAATRVSHAPDITLHELGKFCSLALQCNPTILELLWLPDDLYETRIEYGTWLIQLRMQFLSRQRVRDAYFGYATQQFERLRNRGRFPDVPTNRIAKHGRHMLRLLHQGFELYSTGSMSVEVRYPQKTYFEFGDEVASGRLERAESLLTSFGHRFDEANSPLPEEPNTAAIDNFLRSTRKNLL